MNRGILYKTLREVWVATLLFGIGVFAFEAVLAYIFPRFQEQFQAQILQMEFIRNMISALLGAELGNQLGPMTLGSIAWVHPIILALIWAHVIVFCTRLPVGEIDRGTVDVLFGLPVSRFGVYVCDTFVGVVTTLVILAFALGGCLFGNLSVVPENRPDITALLWVLANLFCLVLAVGGLAFLVSTMSRRRGRAVGTVFGIVLASFFLNFLVQFWEPARAFAFLGLLHYYQPLGILQGGGVPWGNMGVLAGLGVGFWILGAVVFRRRDICTV